MAAKEFKAKGYVLFTRNTTPLEDGEALFIRAKADANDLLKQMYKNPEAEQWRIVPAYLHCPILPNYKLAKKYESSKKAVKKKGVKK